VGNTDILDGDITPAKDIKEVICYHRKHYNLKIENKEQDARQASNLEKIQNIKLGQQKL